MAHTSGPVLLVFDRDRHAGSPVNLTFGSEGGATPPALPLTAQINATLSGIRVNMTAIYDNRLPWSVDARTVVRHQAAAPAESLHRAQWAKPDPITANPAEHWQAATPTEGLPAARWQVTKPTETQAREHWQAATPVAPTLRTVYQVCTPVETLAALGWQAARPMAVGFTATHQVAALVQLQAVLRMRQASPMHRVFAASHQVAADATRSLLARWQEARPLPPGLSIYVPPGGGSTGPGRVIDLNMVFACPAYAGGPVELVFGRVCGVTDPELPPATLFILPSRYYMAVHSLSAVRLPDMAPVAISGVELAADKGSFDWSLTAQVRAEAIDMFAPVSGLRPAIQITLDGLDFVFTVDKFVESEAFGARSFTLTGRSVTSLIAGTRARETSRLNTAARTAQQLALEALEYSGVDLDWGIPDWLVPAGAWSHTGTPLAAVQAIVEAAGGYLQSHRTLPTLLARHPYPDLPGGGVGAPWYWESTSFAADVELALDATMVRGTEHVDGAEINGVYVSGVSQGFGRFYKRYGTAGDLLAPMVTDPLITADEVARMRGRAIVGATGAKHMVSIELPVLTGASQPGILEVGQLVQLNAASPWRGRVRSVRASAKFGEKVRQTVQIERHLEQV